ncbi:HTH-type transcriptional activator RhaR [bioreactor metagenome]|uniref:HTH-type transcriptional activator RhaR n=1 Tax=bioreactor metagenome TaxID=1076179 RepID=A0A644Y0D6_9ZZZZ
MTSDNIFKDHLVDNNYDINYIGKILSSFTKSTGLYMECVDMEGKTFYNAEGSQICDFCSYVREQPSGNKRCERSYKRACKEATKWKTPYFFKCHAGLVMWAVPLIVADENIGCIVCGQVLLWEADQYFIEEILDTNQDIFCDENILKEKLEKLEVISADKCQSSAELLFLVVNYIIKTDKDLFLQEKNKSYWRNEIIKEIESRKSNQYEKIFDYETYLKREKRLLQYIRVGNKDKIMSLLPIIFTDLDVLSDFTLEITKKRCIELVSLISRAIVEGGLDAKVSIMEMNKFHESIKDIKSTDELFYYMNEFIIELVENVFILSENKQQSLLKDARKYINDNYNKNISIEDISNSIYISSSYLSHLFKDNLNCTVNNYLTRVRIEKSIELMPVRELTIQEISKKVGFNNQGHFTKVFKKYIGITPIRYRNELL